LVTSTANEIGRIPAWVSRVRIHAGEDADGSMPRTIRAT
jgi:hypothetical protein